jgi:hypothetical protein
MFIGELVVCADLLLLSQAEERRKVVELELKRAQEAEVRHTPFSLLWSFCQCLMFCPSAWYSSYSSLENIFVLQML